MTMNIGNGVRSNNQVAKEKHLLQRGDIIRLEPGMKVYADMPSMFRGGVFFDTKPCHHDITIGKIYRNAPKSIQTITEEVFDRIQHMLPVNKEQISDFIDSLRIDTSEKTFDTSIYAGEYKVLIAGLDGGGHCNDGDYPDGWHVFCYKLDSPTEVQVDFYQTGCFTAVIEEIEPINR